MDEPLKDALKAVGMFILLVVFIVARVYFDSSWLRFGRSAPKPLNKRQLLVLSVIMLVVLTGIFLLTH